MEVVFLCILSVTSVILGFTTFNLLRKNEQQEDILAGYLNYLDRFQDIQDILNDFKLKEIK